MAGQRCTYISPLSLIPIPNTQVHQDASNSPFSLKNNIVPSLPCLLAKTNLKDATSSTSELRQMQGVINYTKNLNISNSLLGRSSKNCKPSEVSYTKKFSYYSTSPSSLHREILPNLNSKSTLKIKSINNYIDPSNGKNNKLQICDGQSDTKLQSSKSICKTNDTECFDSTTHDIKSVLKNYSVHIKQIPSDCKATIESSKVVDEYKNSNESINYVEEKLKKKYLQIPSVKSRMIGIAISKDLFLQSEAQDKDLSRPEISSSIGNQFKFSLPITMQATNFTNYPRATSTSILNKRSNSYVPKNLELGRYQNKCIMQSHQIADEKDKHKNTTKKSDDLNLLKTEVRTHLKSKRHNCKAQKIVNSESVIIANNLSCNSTNISSQTLPNFSPVTNKQYLSLTGYEKPIVQHVGTKRQILAPRLSSSSSQIKKITDTSTETKYEQSLPSLVISDRHYILNEILRFREDMCHEFKGHRNISIYDIPKPCFNREDATRNAVSV